MKFTNIGKTFKEKVKIFLKPEVNDREYARFEGLKN